MADPTTVSLGQNKWTKVATNITQINIQINGWAPGRHYKDYRLTGEAAPTTLTTAAQITANPIVINTTPAIDVYIYSLVSGDTALVTQI